MNAVTLSPGSESDVREVLLSETEPLHIAGGQSRLIATEKKNISTSQLNGIVDYEPGALTMVAKAGTPLSVIKDTCLLYTSPSPRDISGSRMPSSA